MKLEKYELNSDVELELFEFVSIGTKGRIIKNVQYVPTNYKNLYNLGFGDKNIETGEVDDKVISNNGDSEMVLATIVETLYVFTNKYPEAMVYVTGSTKSRMRLYRMGISKYLKEVKEHFNIFGEAKGGEWVKFKKGIDYTAFLITRKLK